MSQSVLTVGVRELKTRLNEYRHYAQEGGIVYITNHGYREAALVSVADAQTIEAARQPTTK